MIDFQKCFKLLTGNAPFAWQIRLYEKFLADEIPSSCDIPTGLGKTSIIAIWLLALAENLIEKPQANKIPRRLVYVVDRRVIVDQATETAKDIFENLKNLKDSNDKIRQIYDALLGCSFINGGDSCLEKEPENVIEISTLRGEYADNSKWYLDPSRPAIIVGTIDMIGSRLLFSGYGKLGKSYKALQAGLIGQDSLIVTDEAHLSPSFVALLDKLQPQIYQTDKLKTTKTLKPFRLMQLSATLNNQSAKAENSETKTEVFRVDETDEDLQDANSVVSRRFYADKSISLCEFPVEVEKLKGTSAPENFREAQVKFIVERAFEYANQSAAIVIYAQEVKTVKAISKLLSEKLTDKNRILTMTGGMRGKERDEITKDDGNEQNEVFKKFIPQDNREKPDGVWFLVATSTAEVGINLDADHAVCDLSSLDSLTQRIGRVNRFGNGRAEITIVYSQQQINVSQKYFDALYKLREAEETFEKFETELESIGNEVDKADETVKSAQLIFNEAKQEAAQRKVSKKCKHEITIRESEKAQNAFDEAKKKLDEHKLSRNEIKRKLSEIKSRKEDTAKEAKALTEEFKKIAETYVRPLALEEAEISTYRKLEANEVDGKIDASPSALKKLSGDKNCYPVAPICPPLDAARIDDWAMTSISGKDFPRSQVAPFLRGVIDDETSETRICWRADLKFAATDEDAQKMVEIVPVSTRETARETTSRAVALMKILIPKTDEMKAKDKPFFILVDSSGESEVRLFSELNNKKSLDGLFQLLAFKTVILPCEIGGLKNGLVISEAKDLLKEKSKEIESVKDVAEILTNEKGVKTFSRFIFEPHMDGWMAKSLVGGESIDEKPQEINELINSIEKSGNRICVHQSLNSQTAQNDDDAEENEDAPANNKTSKAFVAYFVNPKSPEKLFGEDDIPSKSTGAVKLQIHIGDVENYARNLAEKLYLSAELTDALRVAGKWHDVGKSRIGWQRAIGNKNYPEKVWAKSASNKPNKDFQKYSKGYRHEFGSLIEAETSQDDEIKNHPQRELILHLIAAHHGWARPYFPERAYKTEIQPDKFLRGTTNRAMQRFARLQNEFGWWQLAYLEAILKCADAMASRDRKGEKE
jgi:CRISPR-associated helicase Cas3